jgi:hypothetical protein
MGQVLNRVLRNLPKGFDSPIAFTAKLVVITGLSPETKKARNGIEIFKPKMSLQGKRYRLCNLFKLTFPSLIFGVLCLLMKNLMNKLEV